MPEYVMEFDVDENGKLINCRRKEELIRCRDCMNRQYDALFNIAWCKWRATKPNGYCYEGRNKNG